MGLAPQPETLDRFVFAERALGPVSQGSFRAVLAPLRQQDEIPTPSHVIFFPRTATWAIPEGRDRYLCDPGVVSFWSRGQVCLREPARDAEVDGEWFSFAPDAATELVGECDPGALWGGRWLFRRQSVPVGTELFGRQRRLVAAIQSGRCDAEHGAEAILCLAADCLRLAAGSRAAAPDADRSARRDRDLAEAVRLRMASDPAARSSLVELARAFGVGMVTLCTTFHRVTGHGIHAYRLDLRLKLALERLEHGAGDLSGIALDLGFDSHSHFARQFRRRFGVSPSRARADVSCLGRLRSKDRDSAISRRR